jgi:hypothetical protein
MGGEQQAVLVYGPKKSYSFMELIELFGLVDKKEWVKKFMETEDHDYEPFDDDEDELEGIDIIFDQEFNENDADDVVMNFLNKFHLSIAFDNNCNWGDCYIGAIVDDYKQFMYPVKKMNNVNIKTVNDFCEKYKLPKPTFFGGIIGEFE